MDGVLVATLTSRLWVAKCKLLAFSRFWDGGPILCCLRDDLGLFRYRGSYMYREHMYVDGVLVATLTSRLWSANCKLFTRFWFLDGKSMTFKG